MYNKRLVRVTDNVWIAGVCAGVADYFGFDRDATRIVWLLLTLFTAGFPGLILYIAFLLLMPVSDSR